MTATWLPPPQQQQQQCRAAARRARPLLSAVWQSLRDPCSSGDKLRPAAAVAGCLPESRIALIVPAPNGRLALCCPGLPITRHHLSALIPSRPYPKPHPSHLQPPLPPSPTAATPPPSWTAPAHSLSQVKNRQQATTPQQQRRHPGTPHGAAAAPQWRQWCLPAAGA